MGWRRLLILISTVSVLFTTFQSASGQNAVAGITVTPVRDEFSIARGSEVERKLRVINPLNKSITLYPRVLDFFTDNDQGQPTFFSPGEQSRSYALSNWVSFSKNAIEVAPNQEFEFIVNISAPNDAEPGGHYGAVLFSTEPPALSQAGSQIGIVGLVGTLLLATVPGNIKESAIIEKFQVPKIVFKSPVTISTTISNLGNVHIKPTGQINIRRDSQAISSLNINPADSNVLPESLRTFTNSWEFSWKTIGFHDANAALIYGSPEQQLIARSKVLVIPYWLIIAIFGLLLLIVIAIVRHNLRKRKLEKFINQLPKASHKPVLR